MKKILLLLFLAATLHAQTNIYSYLTGNFSYGAKPPNPSVFGKLWFSTTTNHFYFWNTSSVWQPLSDSTNSVSVPVSVANGGTGVGTFTANGVLYGNGTGNILVTGAGTTGQVLTATTGSAPTWQAAAGGGVTSVTASSPLASSGGATPNITVLTTASMTAGRFNSTYRNSSYSIAGVSFISDTGTNNVWIGQNNAASLTTASANVAVGANALTDLTTGSYNTAVGNSSGLLLDKGANNTLIGEEAGSNQAGTTSNDNTSLGFQAGNSITSGSQNTSIGSGAQPTSATAVNRTSIGFGAMSAADNSIQLGNTSVTMVTTSGGITEGGKLILQSVTKAANYTFDASGTDYIVQETGNGTTVTLPATATNGRECIVVFANTTAANTMTVSGNGHNIDGAASVTLSAKTSVSITIISSIRVVGDGTNWWIEAGF